jgi:hypothetical protein
LRLKEMLIRCTRPRSRPPRGIDYPVLTRTPKACRLGSDETVGDVFNAHSGRPTSKWVHYPEIYDKYLKPIRARCSESGKAVRLVEVGVAEGGSLEVWFSYFGPSSQIVGVDINPQVSGLFDSRITVVTGSQSDRAVLQSCLNLLDGGIDVVIDDGSHLGSDQITTFEYFWPKLEAGGAYLVEDLHTSYWSHFRGGPGRRGTFIEYAKLLIDDMHLNYHRRVRTNLGSLAALTVESISFHDSVVAIVKGNRPSPSRIEFGVRTS